MFKNVSYSGQREAPRRKRATQKPIQRVNVDFTGSKLEDLEAGAKELGISPQGVIKTMFRQALDQRQTTRPTHRRR